MALREKACHWSMGLEVPKSRVMPSLLHLLGVCHSRCEPSISAPDTMPSCGLLSKQ